MKFYGYKNCSTCRKAKKLLQKNAVDFEEIDITVQPPSKRHLQSILKSNMYTIKDLFNRCGVLYREMNMKEKINTLPQEDMLNLLAEHGKLVKRPILLTDSQCVVGFDEQRIKALCR